MGFFRGKLEPADQKRYQTIADLLGPIGEPALRELCEIVFEVGREEGETSGYQDGVSAGRESGWYEGMV